MKANMRDAIVKGRFKHNIMRGADNGRSKLSWEQSEEIRTKYIPRKYSQYKLAKEYGVSQAVISDIILRKTYREKSESVCLLPR